MQEIRVNNLATIHKSWGSIHFYLTNHGSSEYSFKAIQQGDASKHLIS